MKKLSQTLRAYNSRMCETILLNLVCGVLKVEGVCTIRYENDTREHGAICVL